VSVDGVVLVHGSNHCAACWDSVLAHLVAPAIAVDLPGRGSRSTTIEGVTLDDCVQVVIEAADQAGLDRVVLVGHSLGGMTVTETAWRHPERVARLIYVAGSVRAGRQRSHRDNRC
jgi:pimeloyl-ACP methyl ester carboxylesterase